MKDMEYYLTKEKPPIKGWTPDCKYPVVYGERGKAKFKIVADLVYINKFFEFATKYFLKNKDYEKALSIDYFDDEFGRMEIRGGELRTEAEKCLVDFTLSYPAVVTITQITEQLKSKIPYCLVLELVHNYNPVKFEKECFLVKKFQEAYEEITRFDGTPVTTTGGTYAKVMPNIVAFGPSFPGKKGIGHNPNE